jgi:two-component system nitrate/nitrite sensor histidine kinase NarX
VEAAAKLARDGRADIAAAQLDRLGNVVREAHADVREHIMNLRTTPSFERPFFTVVQQYLERFSNNYDIQTQLTIGPTLDTKAFSPNGQLQVFRIVQEALSNARKHSQARHVQVKFESDGERVYVTIQDDGSGFSQDDMALALGNHYGLQFMGERAGQLGASLQVQSTPGQGTMVVLEVPGREF